MKGQQTIFEFIKEFGMTCQPMNTAADIAGKPKSQILSVNWYDMRIRENEGNSLDNHLSKAQNQIPKRSRKQFH